MPDDANPLPGAQKERRGTAGARGWTDRSEAALRRPVAGPDPDHRGDRELAAPPEYAYARSGTPGPGWATSAATSCAGPQRRGQRRPAGAAPRAERAIFDRVLDLGWTPERFIAFDRDEAGATTARSSASARSTSGSASTRSSAASPTTTISARPGKAEATALRVPRAAHLARHRPDGPGPEHGIPAARAAWFSPARGPLPGWIAADYPADMTGYPRSPGPDRLLDPHGTPWLTLEATPAGSSRSRPRSRRSASHDARHGCSHRYLVPVTDARPAEWAGARTGSGGGCPRPPTPQPAPWRLPRRPAWSAADGSIE